MKTTRNCGVTHIGVAEVIGSILSPHHVIAKGVNSCTYCCCNVNSMSRGTMPWPKPGAILYYPQLGLLDKSRVNKGFVISNGGDISAFGPARRSGYALLSTVPFRINCEQGWKHYEKGSSKQKTKCQPAI